MLVDGGLGSLLLWWCMSFALLPILVQLMSIGISTLLVYRNVLVEEVQAFVQNFIFQPFRKKRLQLSQIRAMVLMACTGLCCTSSV